jgi:signal transduction histidine kinase
VGLPFCKEVMESMGGSIKCLSELGKGTEFILKFERI